MTPRTGKQSRDRGEQFEADLLRAYRPPSVYLQRTSPPWRYVRAGRVLKVVVTEEGVPDFHAAVDGRAVVLDAKATAGDRWEFDHLTIKQAEHFDAADARGVLAGILLRWDARQVVHWLPWPALAPRWYAWRRGTSARGGASITPRDAAELGREVVGLRWWEVVQNSS